MGRRSPSSSRSSSSSEARNHKRQSGSKKNSSSRGSSKKSSKRASPSVSKKRRRSSSSSSSRSKKRRRSRRSPKRESRKSSRKQSRRRSPSRNNRRRRNDRKRSRSGGSRRNERKSNNSGHKRSKSSSSESTSNAKKAKEPAKVIERVRPPSPKRPIIYKHPSHPTAPSVPAPSHAAIMNQVHGGNQVNGVGEEKVAEMPKSVDEHINDAVQATSGYTADNHVAIPPNTSVDGVIYAGDIAASAGGVRYSGIAKAGWSRGFGFITPNENPEDGDVFCHMSALLDGNFLEAGATVTYEIGENEKTSQICAQNVVGGVWNEEAKLDVGMCNDFKWNGGCQKDNCKYSHTDPAMTASYVDPLALYMQYATGLYNYFGANGQQSAMSYPGVNGALEMEKAQAAAYKAAGGNSKASAEFTGRNPYRDDYVGPNPYDDGYGGTS